MNTYYITDPKITPPPEPNLELGFGVGFILQMTVPKTVSNRIKYKLLCWLLPFKILKWEKLK